MSSHASSRLWSAAVGALSGARTVCAPVLVSRRLRAAPRRAADRVARVLRSELLSGALVAGAIVEVIIDKLPLAGDRTTAVGLAFRSVAGGLAGAAVAPVDRHGGSRSAVIGAVLGGTAAFAATFATFRVRSQLHQRMRLPDAAAGLLEDVAIYELGRWVVGRALDKR